MSVPRRVGIPSPLGDFYALLQNSLQGRGSLVDGDPFLPLCPFPAYPPALRHIHFLRPWAREGDGQMPWFWAAEGAVNRFVWGPVMLAVLVGVGVYLSLIHI